jgi:hypothetical protein
MARIPDGDDGRTVPFRLVATESHREGGDVWPERVVAVDERKRGKIDDDIGVGLAPGGSRAEAREKEAEKDNPMRVEPPPVRVDKGP